ncbi:hypothetical protein DB347_14530 [Opitutaceae bacterium EW11]|nr:hypothetical protein DB347_14530 [Opitutaceae bacterium EW11]
MKTLLSALLALCVAGIALAQPTGEIGTPKRTPEELEKLLAPIALYPDSLVALILPASTVSADVVLAARYLADGGDPKEIDVQAWDSSVRSLARYPGLVKWMDENLAWTRELGEAFVAQPADVMTSIQKIRADAQAKGLLADTAQQKVVVRESEICILPANPEVIYVPYYDPEILFLNRPRSDVWLTFSVGFPIGSWLYYDCDWGHRTVWIYRRPPGWVYHPGWRWHEPHRPINSYCDAWRPNPRYWHDHRVRPLPPPEHRRMPHVGPARGVVEVPPSQWRERDRNRGHDRDGGPWQDGNPGRGDNRRDGDRRHGPGDRNRVQPPIAPQPAVSPQPTVTPGNPVTSLPNREPDTRSAARWREIRERRTPPSIAEQPRQPHSPVHSAPPPVINPPAPRTERVGSVTPRDFSRPPARVEVPSAPRFQHPQPVSPPPVHHSAPAPSSSSRSNNDQNSNQGASSSTLRTLRAR